VLVTEFKFLQLLLVQSEGERLASDRFTIWREMHPHEAEGPAGLLLGRADAEQPSIAS
jgi:hypothetical protein